MRKSFLEWLQDYAVQAGLVGLVEGMLAVMAFAGALSALFGSAAIKAGAMFAVIFAVLGLIVLLSFNRIQLKNQAELYGKLLARYSAIMAERPRSAYRNVSWVDEFVISPNGDVREKITVRAIVESDSVYFHKIFTGAGWAQPKRYRDGVRAEARALQVGDGGGTRRDIATLWSERGNLEILADLGEPVPRNGEVALQFAVDWPGRCVPLMRRRVPEEFALTFDSSPVHMEYLIVLPAGFDAHYDVIGLVADRDTFELSRTGGDGRAVEVRLDARNVERGRRVGLRLDLK